MDRRPVQHPRRHSTLDCLSPTSYEATAAHHTQPSTVLPDTVRSRRRVPAMGERRAFVKRQASIGIGRFGVAEVVPLLESSIMELVDCHLGVRHGKLPLEFEEIAALFLFAVVCQTQLDHHAGAAALVVITKTCTKIT